MDKEIAEEIIRENRYPSGYDIQDYLFDNEDTVLSLEDGTELLDDFDPVSYTHLRAHET